MAQYVNTLKNYINLELNLIFSKTKHLRWYRHSNIELCLIYSPLSYRLIYTSSLSLTTTTTTTSTPITLICNRLKSTNINGTLTLSVYTVDGVTNISQICLTSDILVSGIFLLQVITSLRCF